MALRNIKTRMTLTGAVGALLGAIGALTFNPGHLTPEEGAHLVRDWAAALQSMRQFETIAGRIDWNLQEGNSQAALKGWSELRPLYVELNDRLDIFARNFWDFYRYDEVKVGALEPGVENPVVELIRRARSQPLEGERLGERPPAPAPRP